jgi:hypothetical protein
MRTATLILAALLLALPAVGQEVKSYTVVEGHGADLILAADGDTLDAYFEHIEKTETPDWQAARGSDLVIWCYPDRHTHPSHIFPDAEGRIYSVRVGGIITFYTEDALEGLPAKTAKMIRRQ